VSKVRSLTMDSLAPPLLRLMRALQLAQLPPGAPPPPRARARAPHAAAPAVGPNAVWEARPLESVRRPVASDAADGPGPREHREVFVRLKYEIREFVDKPAAAAAADAAADADAADAADDGTADALGEALWAAAETDEPLLALQLLAAGASASWSRAPAAVAAAGAAEAEGEGVSVLAHARDRGSELVAELLQQNFLQGGGRVSPAAAADDSPRAFGSTPQSSPSPPWASEAHSPNSALTSAALSSASAVSADAVAAVTAGVGQLSDLASSAAGAATGVASSAAGAASAASTAAGAALAKFPRGSAVDAVSAGASTLTAG